MRSYPVICAFVIVAGLFPCAHSLFLSKRLWPNASPLVAQEPPICDLSAKDCKSKVTVCGRKGDSGLCQKFQNTCCLDAGNCVQEAIHAPHYAVVDNELCENIALNARGPCKGVALVYPNGGVPTGGYYGTYPNNAGYYGVYPNRSPLWPFGYYGQVANT